MDVILKKIYVQEDSFLADYALPFLLIFTFSLIIFIYYIKANLYESKTDWSTNRCVPKYMFVSGFINKEPGSNVLASIYDNFASCVKQYKNTPYVKPNPDEVTIRGWNLFSGNLFV
jgi:hypothetical protein